MLHRLGRICVHLCFLYMYDICSLRWASRIHLDSRDIRHFSITYMPEQKHRRWKKKWRKQWGYGKWALLELKAKFNQTVIKPMRLLFLVSEVCNTIYVCEYLLIISGLHHRHFSTNWISVKRLSWQSKVFFCSLLSSIPINSIFADTGGIALYVDFFLEYFPTLEFTQQCIRFKFLKLQLYNTRQFLCSYILLSTVYSSMPFFFFAFSHHLPHPTLYRPRSLPIDTRKVNIESQSNQNQ